jgi:hypothetical protein
MEPLRPIICPNTFTEAAAEPVVDMVTAYQPRTYFDPEFIEDPCATSTD